MFYLNLKTEKEKLCLKLTIFISRGWPINAISHYIWNVGQVFLQSRFIELCFCPLFCAWLEKLCGVEILWVKWEKEDCYVHWWKIIPLLCFFVTNLVIFSICIKINFSQRNPSAISNNPVFHNISCSLLWVHLKHLINKNHRALIQLEWYCWR